MIKRKKRGFFDILRLSAVGLSTLATCAALLWIIGYVVIKGFAAFNLPFFQSLIPMTISTLYMIGLSLVIAVPIGIGAAIYLVEYARPGKLVSAIRFAVESLSGIPSIIFGLFGMILFVKKMHMSWSILAGALTVSIMILPLIIRSTEEALKAVPNSYREASFALGATKLRTVCRIVLPCASSGVITAVILSIGRIVGETAALFLTAGTVAAIPKDIFSSGRTLAIHLYQLAREGISMEQAFATATVLILLVMVINFAASSISERLSRKRSSE